MTNITSYIAILALGLAVGSLWQQNKTNRMVSHHGHAICDLLTTLHPHNIPLKECYENLSTKGA